MTCQTTVPMAIVAFLESEDFESAIRLAISLVGDSDTIASMTGAIAQAFYKEIPQSINDKVLQILPKQMIEVVEEFSLMY
ncbi:ADP-ribosylglycohydrolase family protein [Bacteroidales bacterium OttesenSCG-928-C19]|nr:ADP-ribosylglycohydrolase family protein [Bacteroidales bacterium OttesenSCG-928-C19]